MFPFFQVIFLYLVVLTKTMSGTTNSTSFNTVHKPRASQHLLIARIELNASSSRCHSQIYDGAFNMFNNKSGAAAEVI